MNGSGLFKYEKWISLAGAVINLTTSIILAIKVGLPGVLTGTVVAQVVYWLSRSVVVYDKCFRSSKLFVMYWLRMACYLAVFLGCVFACRFVCGYINTDWKILTFVLRGISCEILCAAIVGVAFIPSDEHRTAVKWALSKVKRTA
jgi:fucose 4-O-acetylase-like acetyltransferase